MCPKEYRLTGEIINNKLLSLMEGKTLLLKILKKFP